MHHSRLLPFSPLLLVLLAGCQTPPRVMPSPQHLGQSDSPPAGSIPAPVPLPAPDQATVAAPVYSIIISRPAPVRELLASIAKDARINLDIHPQISGLVTLNAIRQTLPQILDRLARQVSLRWKLEHGTLIVEPDEPYLQEYTLDYVNISRVTKTEIDVNSGLASVGGNNAAASNGSSSRITTESSNGFWTTLQKNIEEMLRDKEKIVVTTQNGLPATPRLAGGKPAAGSSGSMLDLMAGLNPVWQGGAATPAIPVPASTQRTETDPVRNVMVNPETGVLVVRGTQRQQKQVQSYLAQVRNASLRQVMIEATIAEVELTRDYQAGVDWSRIGDGKNWQFASNFSGNGLSQNAGNPVQYFGTVGQVLQGSTTPAFTGLYRSGSLSAAIRLLEGFGRTRVLSSPKLMALNNQSAILKVVDNVPYFTLKIKYEPGTTTNPPTTTYESELHSVPVGIVMNITPQIAPDGRVSLNVRPTITNITGFQRDPAVQLVLADKGASDPGLGLVPQLQVRELESTLRLQSGEIGVLGGLIQDKVDKDSNGIPLLSQLPVVGALFGLRKESARKTELVVFLKPTLVSQPSLTTDLSALRNALPDSRFLDGRQDFRQIGGVLSYEGNYQ